MKIYLYENRLSSEKLFPICSNRPIFDLKCGVYSIFERVKNIFPNQEISFFVRDEIKSLVREKNNFEINPKKVDEGLWLSSNVLWNENLINEIKNKKNIISYKNKNLGFFLSKNKGNEWISNGGPIDTELMDLDLKMNKIIVPNNYYFEYLWHLLNINNFMLQNDSKNFKMGKILSERNEDFHLINKKNIFISKNSEIRTGTILDAKLGPIIISENVIIEPGAYVQGPVFIDQNVIIKPFSKILKNTTIGAGCKIGGEISECIFQGWSNKQHDGFLGHSYIGEWVNLGAGTNNSDLKNNYSNVKVYIKNKLFDTNQLFIGVFIGDYSKSAISTRFNTGTIVGIGSNIVSNIFPPKNIKEFSWIIDNEINVHNYDKFIQTAKISKSRRDQIFTKNEQEFFFNYFKQNEIDVD